MTSQVLQLYMEWRNKQSGAAKFMKKHDLIHFDRKKLNLTVNKSPLNQSDELNDVMMTSSLARI